MLSIHKEGMYIWKNELMQILILLLYSAPQRVKSQHPILYFDVYLGFCNIKNIYLTIKSNIVICGVQNEGIIVKSYIFNILTT